MTPTTRIVVFGAQGSNVTNDSVRLEWFDWDELGEVSNLSEYDVVFLSLLSKPPNDRIDWKTFYQQVFTLRAVRDVLGHGGEIVVVGDPTFDVVTLTSRGSEYVEPFLSWTGLGFTWDRRPGEGVRTTPSLSSVEKLFGGYLSQFRTWTYALDRCELSQLTYEFLDRYPDLDSTKRPEFRSQIQTIPLLANRSGGALAFIVKIEFQRDILHKPRGMAYSVQPE